MLKIIQIKHSFVYIIFIPSANITIVMANYLMYILKHIDRHFFWNIMHLMHYSNIICDFACCITINLFSH